MTNVQITQRKGEVRVSVNGHAEYLPRGPDIVCSACSTLSYTLLQALLEMEQEGLVTVRQSIGDGLFQLRIKYQPEADSRLQTVLRVIAGGFALLQQRYPNNVQLHCSADA